jgi:hypothetical protein
MDAIKIAVNLLETVLFAESLKNRRTRWRRGANLWRVCAPDLLWPRWWSKSGPTQNSPLTSACCSSSQGELQTTRPLTRAVNFTEWFKKNYCPSSKLKTCVSEFQFSGSSRSSWKQLCDIGGQHVDFASDGESITFHILLLYFSNLFGGEWDAIKRLRSAFLTQCCGGVTDTLHK